MREVKVRGYAVEEMVGSQWVYGTGVHRTVFSEEFAKECGQSGETFIWTESSWVLVHDDSVGQYTGLHDRDGKKIYEGDIVRRIYVEESFNRVIEYKNEEACFVARPPIGDYLHDEAVYLNDQDFEIVGNVFEHSDLLDDMKGVQQ